MTFWVASSVVGRAVFAWLPTPLASDMAREGLRLVVVGVAVEDVGIQ